MSTRFAYDRHSARRKPGSRRRPAHNRARLRSVLAALLALLAALITAPAALALSPPKLYWGVIGTITNPFGAIATANVDGTGMNQSFVTGLSSAQRGIALDGSHIYWADGPGNQIGRANLDGTSVNQTFIITAHPYSVAVDASHIYWTSPVSNTIGEADLDGTHVNPSFISTQAQPIGLAVDGRHIYWADGRGNQIGRANLDGTDVNQSFITGAQDPAVVTVTGSHIYWSNFGDYTIGEANLDGTDVNQSFIPVPAGGLAVDASHIYWTGAHGSIGEANLDGTDVNANAFAASNAFEVAVSVPIASVELAAPAAFASTPQGELAPAQMLTITNRGQQDLLITGLSFAGADPGDFVVSSNSCLAPVAPDASCQVGVSFAPQAQGARAASLKIASTDYANSPLEVPLSGTGGSLAAGPQGVPGSVGPQGAQGPQGPQGAAGVAGTVVCQNTVLAKILCALEFAPGTYETAGSNALATFTIRHGGRVVIRGTFRVRHGQITSKRIRRLRRGRYTLTVTVRRGHRDTVLLHQAVVVD